MISYKAVGYTGGDFAIARYLGTGQPQLDNFQLQTPPDQSVNQNFSNLAFNWTDAYLATSYEFEIDSSQTFSANPQTTTVAASSTIVPPTASGPG